MNALPVRPEVARAVRAGRALTGRLENAVRAYRRPGLTPPQQRQWRVNVHRRRGRLQDWAAAVLAQLGPRVDELNVRELDLLANTLAGAQSAFNREGRGTPVSVPRMLRLIGARLRLPAF